MTEATTSNLQPGPGIQKVLKPNLLPECFFLLLCKVWLVGWLQGPHWAADGEAILMARPGHLLTWGGVDSWPRLGRAGSRQLLCIPEHAGAGAGGRSSPGAETWFSYPWLVLGREHRHELEGIPESLTLQPKIFIFKTVSHRLFLFGVDPKLSNFGKEEMITQFLFEETTEMADAKIKITTHKPRLLKRRETQDSTGCRGGSGGLDHGKRHSKELTERQAVLEPQLCILRAGRLWATNVFRFPETPVLHL